MKTQVSVYEPCRGIVPLRARLENWMVTLLEEPKLVHDLLDKHGAPLNIQSDAPFRGNIADLIGCVGEFDLPFLPMFARKANKCLTYVDAARDINIGIDTASHAEVVQCLDRGLPGDRIVCTAAVKDQDLMSLCVANGVTIILDNLDEITLLEEVVQYQDRPVSVGLRLNGFEREGQPLYSRFGLPLRKIPDIATRLSQTPQITLDGLHFHLNGYSSADRIAAIAQTLPVITALRHSIQRDFFLDIGGGIPMNYLDDPAQWDTWKSELDAALGGTREPITQHNVGLGRTVDPDGAKGSIDSYPVAQGVVQTDWMREILNATDGGKTIANRLRDAKVSLRCEPGRSVLDGCGMTLARVAFCKTDSAGVPVIGVQMNRTQSRSGFSEFALDPLMVPGPEPRGDPVEGYLAGTYCTESEWLTRRKMVFPAGVRPGDIMVFPNTAGYLMHFLESRSHQFPLAKNVFLQRDGTATLDAIDTD
ncbi:Y4yA family PLP-dependent enzyme [Sulfitobacter sp. F26169L]|uniref:Y4yA family PLP-dependent enzyme n=1 Tax=Sulfitobacter sp. F26169L TaxID=2996015 RepID=UPI002260E5EA|nr:Y4yA family PLP-dependent enzyme [Sulfitobacter sp. F26169L]MCX7567703.1 Y4yA family PLP-dependent enzyme [Sulfitobacter sp. F26169L]